MKTGTQVRVIADSPEELTAAMERLSKVGVVFSGRGREGRRGQWLAYGVLP